MEEEQRLTKKERRMLRRQERESRGGPNADKGFLRKILIWSSVILTVFIIGYFIYQKVKNSVNVVEIGESFASEGRDHIEDGKNVDYKTNPPTSGPHYGLPSYWGIIDHEIPDEAVVHNLEHGGVWISYRAEISPVALEKLKTIVKDAGSKTLMAPRSENDKDVAVTSWGRSYKFDLNSDGSFDETAVKNYIKQYMNTGPELVPDNMPSKNY